MTPQEYQQILLLRKPLKALALCCISGSLSGAHTLSNYLVDNPVERHEASQIIPAVLDTLLALDEVPHALDFGTFELVQTALLLLSAFSHLSLIAEEEAIAAGRFVKHEATIFSWLSFLQRHLFGPPAPNLLSLIEDARPDFLMVMILVTQTLTNYLHRPQPEIDFTRCEYITNTTFELWSLLQRTSYDDCHRTTMLVTNYTSGVVTAFIENSLNNQSHHFVDKIGGISSVVPLFLSAVDYYWNHTVSQLNRRVPPYAFASLEQLLCDALTLVNSHHFRDHVDIPSSVRYLTSAIHWVLKTRVHILERLPQDFNNGYLAPRTYIQSYVKFITTSLSHPRYYLVWNDLDMRVMKTLRSGLPSDYDPLSKLSGVFSLLANCLTFNSEWFPTILRKTMKLRSLPTLPVYQPIWDAFDNNLHAFQLSLKGAMMIAEQYDSCRTCRQKSRTCQLRVCSGCRVVRYCSTLCQGTAWAEGHRYLCKLLRLSGGTHPLFRTDDSVGLSYVATLELLWRRMCEFSTSVDDVLSPPEQSPQPLPLGELPLVCLTIPRQSSNVQLERKRFKDFPSIFSGEEWSTTLVPQLKKHIDAREIPSFLVVVSLTLFHDEYLHILSPLNTLHLAGLFLEIDESYADF